MSQATTKVHQSTISGRLTAFTDARLAIANLCASERSPEYRAAIADVLRTIELMTESEASATPTVQPTDDAYWDAAVTAVGTARVPPYGFPVVVLTRPADVRSLHAAIDKQLGIHRQQGPLLLDGNHREKLTYAARVLRATSDVQSDAPIGPLRYDARMAAEAIQSCLGLADCDLVDLGSLPSTELPPGFKPWKHSLLAGWLAAAQAWDVCASIHATYAKGRDGVFKTRQRDFVNHAHAAREKYLVVAKGLSMDATKAE